MYVGDEASDGRGRSSGSAEVPLHLRNATTRLMEAEGFGEGYRYAHDEPDAFAAGEDYFPDALSPQRFYEPTDRGWRAAFARSWSDSGVSTRRQRPAKPNVAGSEFELSVGVSLTISSDINHDLSLRDFPHLSLDISR